MKIYLIAKLWRIDMIILWVFTSTCCSLIVLIALLQDKKLLDLPKLLDICAIYGHENEDLTRTLVCIYVTYFLLAISHHCVFVFITWPQSNILDPQNCSCLLQFNIWEIIGIFTWYSFITSKLTWAYVTSEKWVVSVQCFV